MTAINRPWNSTFDSQFAKAAFDDKSVEQVLKLCRNFVCSLNLGAPYVKHATPENGVADTPREEYLAWVKQWKRTYNQLSSLIRELRRYRKDHRFAGHYDNTLKQWHRHSNKSSQDLYWACRRIKNTYEERLSETANMMLNARYNAKLAAAEAHRRERANRELPAETSLAA